MPKQSIPATAEGLPEAKMTVAAMERIYGDICGLSYMTKILADMLDELLGGESFPREKHETDQASFAWNDVVARAVRLEGDFCKAMHGLPNAPKRSGDLEKKRTLLGAMDELTQARDLYEAAWMAANSLSQREERKAMTALLHLGNDIIVAGLEKLEEYRSAGS